MPNLPPTDDELYAAELTLTMKDKDRLAKMEEEKEVIRVARAGEPEAQEALKATAAFQGGVPVNDFADTTERDTGVVATPKKVGRPRKVERALTGESNQPASRSNGADPAPRRRDPSKAYDLMDGCWKKWAVSAKKNPREACRELALDLGGDTSLYLESGVLRMADMLDAVLKLLALPKSKEDDVEGGENFDQALEDLRKQLRG